MAQGHYAPDLHNTLPEYIERTEVAGLSQRVDGPAWAASQIRVGLLGGGSVYHHRPENWRWDRTRQTLEWALRGYVVKSRRVPDAPEAR